MKFKYKMTTETISINCRELNLKFESAGKERESTWQTYGKY